MGSSNDNFEAGRGDDLVGQVVAGRYRVHSLLAVGGMAEVYLAEHIHIRKLFAFKILRRQSERFHELSARFEREAIAGAHVTHPHIASATDFGTLDDGSCFVAMEYVEGETLSTMLRRGPIAAERARHILRQLASALAACHALGVLHRDIKPGNIMVDESRGDRVKLIDFGLARVPVARVSSQEVIDVEPEDEPTRTVSLRGVVFGTVTYMPPEIVRGMEAIDARSDLYALGVVLFEMLAGRPPVEARDPAISLMSKRSLPPLVREVSPTVQTPDDLEQIARRLLAPAPDHRFQSAEALLQALDEEPSAREPAWLRASSTLRILPAVIVATGQRVRGASRTKSMLALTAGVALVLWLFAKNLAVHESVPLATEGIAAAVEQVEVDDTQSSTASPEAPVAADVEHLREQFIDAHRRGRLVPATRALRSLVEKAPTGMAHPEARKRAGALLALLEFGERDVGTSLTEALAQAGEPGWDVLYEVLSAWGGTRAAERATAILAREPIRATCSPALKVALELRETRCASKPALFARAAEHGDVRTRIYLNQLRSKRCDPRIGQCCFHANQDLDRAVRALRSKGSPEAP